MLNEQAGLAAAAAAFRLWAERFPTGGRCGEWEAEYEDWSQVYAAVVRFLDANSPNCWDDEAILDLLYLLARDNETELIRDNLVDRPAHLQVLAQTGLRSNERDARWQLADALGEDAVPDKDALSLLQRFFEDADEYVSRRALLSLGRRQAPVAEALAIRAWHTGFEYQRIAALHVLASLCSPLLPHYLRLADKDGRKHLVSNASSVRSNHKAIDGTGAPP